MLSYPEYFLKRWPWKEHPLYLFLKKQYKKTNNLKSWAKNPNLNPIPNNKKKNSQTLSSLSIMSHVQSNEYDSLMEKMQLWQKQMNKQNKST